MVNKITTPITPLGEIDKINEVIDEVDKKLDKSGGTMTGDLSVNNSASITTNGYVVGTWLQTKSASVNNNLTTVAMLDGNGWIYKQSKDTLLSGAVKSVNNTSPDSNGNVTISIPTAVTESTVSGWGFTKNAGTVTSVNNISPTNGNVTLSIPAAQVQSNWNETSTSSKAYIQNKPTIPTVNNATLTITQGGITKGTFTANASSDVTIALDAGGGGTTEYVRNIGEIVTSTIPLTDAGLHLLDGALISGSGIYSDFVTYISGLVSNYPDLFISESDWQTSVTTYGSCGKFVYDSVNNTVRLPKISNILEGTTEVNALGDLVEAGLPNITGNAAAYALSDGSSSAGSPTGTGAFRWATSSKSPSKPSAVYDSTNANKMITFNASLSSSIYGNSTTVQPQTIKVLYYIVVATSAKTDIQVDIDEIATDLNIALDQYKYDGQWVESNLNIYQGNRLATDTNYSLSNYLPNDNYNYEVLFYGAATTGSTSGNQCRLYLKTDILSQDEIYVCNAVTRTSHSNNARGTAILPIGAGRIVTIYGTSSDNGTIFLGAAGYRRIGTNN